jgi:general secretion pathway protein A
MYKEYFGFKTEPFNITPDPDLFYCSDQIDEIIKALEYILDKRRGFIVLTGDVGTGKTILSRTLLNKLANFNTTLILNPFLNEEEMLYYICKDFGITKDKSKSYKHSAIPFFKKLFSKNKTEKEDDEEETNELSINKGELFYLLAKFFVKSYKQGKNNLIIVDEAQNLSFEAFEMIRQISNIELDDTKLVQILFVGQPELIDKLNKREYRQLKQRITTVLEMKPLNLTDTINYINFRVQETLHYKKFLFTNSALKLIYKYSKGVPREINQIAELSLTAAFSNNHKMVTKRDVKTAAKEYYRKYNIKQNNSVLILLTILCFLIILFFYLKY